MQKLPKIYIIEDSQPTSSTLSTRLSRENMSATVFPSPEKALEKIRLSGMPDLFILNLQFKEMSGLDFIKILRKEFNPAVPITVVSEQNDEETIIRTLELGADDFVSKPFSPDVLTARIKASLRRSKIAAASQEESICFDDYTLLTNSKILKKNSVKITISSKEYEILEYLAKNAGKTISPEKIYTKVWEKQFGDVTAVAVYVRRLRKKIEINPMAPRYIITDFGKGYKFNKEVII